MNAPTPWLERMGRLEELVRRAERLPDENARSLARELVQMLLDVHGEGMRRLLAAASRDSVTPPAVVSACTEDDLLASLLMLHGLHPEPLRARVDRALAKVRPLLHSHQGDVELLSLDNDVARLRLTGTCKTCPASAETLKKTVEEALYEEAPDLAGYEVEQPPPVPTPFHGGAPMKLDLTCPERPRGAR